MPSESVMTIWDWLFRMIVSFPFLAIAWYIIVRLTSAAIWRSKEQCVQSKSKPLDFDKGH